ncbi:MAG: hypothetical protein JXR37_35295 [Kiritimatiellae bacterium]|nr:hypothetical protein [Kiritimatiellia bacterium]
MKLPALRCERTREALRVRTPYWEVVHDGRLGWCVSSIAIRNGRNRNLLTGPVSSSFCRFRTRVPACPEFSDRYDRTARMAVVSRSRQKICLRVTGALAARSGRHAPVRYETVYTYHDYGGLTTTRRFLANGMRIVPYFSLLELHRDTPEFRAHARAWRKVFEGNEDLLFTQEQGKGFGGLMCLQSGWSECLKAQVKRVLARHDFDGGRRAS